MNSEIDAYLRKAKRWQAEMAELRRIVLALPLVEELKWGKPCYTLDGHNVVLIIAFKDQCALLFCKGALLKDPEGILIRPGENTQAARQIRFRSVAEIVRLERVLKSYLRKALNIEKAGLEVHFKKTSEFKIPEEFQAQLDQSPALKTAFERLTPGRQRGYLLYFSGAMQSKTRAARVAKCREQILAGKGLND